MAPRILLADDSISTRALMSHTLEGAGYSVTQAADGAEALQLFGGADFDLVISDQWMPRKTGIELMREIRGGQRNPEVPILAVTTDTEDAVHEDVVAAGASDCIVKPFAPGVLLSIVARLLSAAGDPHG